MRRQEFFINDGGSLRQLNYQRLAEQNIQRHRLTFRGTGKEVSRSVDVRAGMSTKVQQGNICRVAVREG
jgi:hypothetical protein